MAALLGSAFASAPGAAGGGQAQVRGQHEALAQALMQHVRPDDHTVIHHPDGLFRIMPMVDACALVQRALCPDSDDLPGVQADGI